MIERKQIDVTCKEIANYLNMNPTNVSRYIRRGDRMDLVYAVLNSPRWTKEQKKNYVFNMTSLSDYFKNKIWSEYVMKIN